jgi:flagellar biosynthesis GTPase FlhF
VFNRTWNSHGSTGIGRWLRAFGVGAVLAAALPGCMAHARGEVVYDYPVVTVETVPARIETYPRTYYHGRPAYLVDGRWYYRSGPRWVYFREEPVELRDYRVRHRHAAPHYYDSGPRRGERYSDVVAERRAERYRDDRRAERYRDQRRAAERAERRRAEERREERQRAAERRAAERRVEERRADQRRAEQRRMEERRAAERRAAERRLEERRAEQRRDERKGRVAEKRPRDDRRRVKDRDRDRDRDERDRRGD